jgi:AcrR family transcriptional regulator
MTRKLRPVNGDARGNRSPIGDARFYRTLPVQQRSHETVVAILEAARQAHAAEGLSASLSGIAARAGVTGPAVCRYFDDIHAIRGAVVSQSRWFYLNDVAEYLRATHIASWRDIIVMHIAIRVQSYRAGRAPVEEIAREPSVSESKRLALYLASVITELCRIEVDSAAMQRIELGLRLADALIRRAFLESDEGDPVWISACGKTVVGFIEPAVGELLLLPKKVTRRRAM